MSEHAIAWALVLSLSLVGVIGLFHAGLNVGGVLAGTVQSLERLFGTPLAF